MPKHPNIKRELLEYALDTDGYVNVYECADEHGYDGSRVKRKAHETESLHPINEMLFDYDEGDVREEMESF